MPKPRTKTPIKVTVDIRLGPVTPAQAALYRKFWAKLISQVQDEVKGGENDSV